MVTAAAQPHSEETLIQPPGRWGFLRLHELWEARELLYFVTKRELQIRYKQSFFGVTWAVMQPLAYAFIFALFFGRLAKVGSDGAPYPIFALAALVPWLFLSQGVSQAATSLVAEQDVLSKIYFPRMVIPLARIMSFLVDLAIGLCILTVFTFAYGVTPGIGLVALPGFLLIAAFTAAAAGILLGGLNVKYRDVTLVVPLLLQLWLFITPIAYPASLIKGSWQYLYAVNPMVAVVEGMRWAFVGAPAPSLAVVAISGGTALAALVVSVVYFRRTERFFADIV
jgi:lipopolysaccharide transport system permease protein